MGVSGYDLTGFARIPTSRVGGKPAGLTHQQNAGGQIPALQPQLPISVVAAGSDPGEVERRRTEPADAGDLRHQYAERTGECQTAWRGDGGKRDAGCEQRVLQLPAS